MFGAPLSSIVVRKENEKSCPALETVEPVRKITTKFSDRGVAAMLHTRENTAFGAFYKNDDVPCWGNGYQRFVKSVFIIGIRCIPMLIEAN